MKHNLILISVTPPIQSLPPRWVSFTQHCAWRWAICVITLALLPTIAHAQTVRGTVLSATGEPAAGALLLLVSSNDSVTSRTVASARGEFRFTTRNIGEYRVRVLRIGYRPWTSAPFALNAGETNPFRFTLDDAHVTLATIVTEARTQCRILNASQAATSTAWTQVQTALITAQLTSSARAFAATTVNYSRLFDRQNRVSEQFVTVDTSRVTQPWQSESPDSLHKSGYLTVDGDSLTYIAPGLDALTSPLFLQDHCIKISAVRDSLLLGIDFEPTPARKRLPEIKGTVWVNRKSSELRRIDFSLTNVSKVQESHAGGELTFVQLANGSWAVARWRIAMPLLVQRKMPTGNFDPEILMHGLREVGGELSLAMDRADTLYSRPALVLEGIVSDSVTSAVLPYAQVEIVGSALHATTDTLGRFTIPNLVGSAHTISVQTSVLQRAGLAFKTQVVLWQGQGTINLRVPNGITGTSRDCGLSASASEPSDGAIAGTVFHSGDTATMAGARVQAVWREVTVRRSTTNGFESVTKRLDTKTDALGAFRLCGVPYNTTVTVYAATTSGLSGHSAAMSPAAGQVLKVDIAVYNKRAVVGGVRGYIQNAETKQPIQFARVEFPALGLTTHSGADGRYQLPQMAVGSHTLTVRQLGYGPLDATINIERNTLTEHNIFLTKVQSLDSVVIEATMAMHSFEEHRAVGIGRFLTRDDLAKREQRSLSAVFQDFSGAAIMSGTGTNAFVARARGPQSLSGAELHVGEKGTKPACYAHVYIDGKPYYLGREGDRLFNLNSMSVNEIEAIEFFAGPAQTPLEYSNLKATCGVIVIWTRRTYRDSVEL